MYFVVLSYPRTGSTLVQRVINTSDNFFCIGEKPMAINNLASFVSSLDDAKSVIPQTLFPEIPLDDDRNPVFMAHAVDVDSVVDEIRSLYVRHILGVAKSQNLGWKENFISSYPDEKVANSEVMFIRRLFPEILFILNVRDPHECAKSSIWRYREDSVLEIKSRRDWILRGADNGLFGKNYVVLDYDKWSVDSSELIGKLTSVGININNESAYRVISERLSHISNI